MEKSQLQLFNFKGVANFTVVLINGEPHWVGKEICDYFDIKNYSDSFGKLKEGSQKLKLDYEKSKQIGLTDLQSLQIGTKGIVLLKEAGLYKLSFKSGKQNAEDFTDWISETVLPAIRKTGTFDSVEEKLKLIEDEKEKELSLGLYSLEKAVKANPNNTTISILYDNKKIELNQYKQEKQLAAQAQELELVKNGQEKIEKRVENLFVIGDRVQFVKEVNSISRASGVQQSDIYSSTYGTLKDLYGIDVEQRSKNAKKKIQAERLKKGKAEYSTGTLNKKAGKLNMVEESKLWNEISRSLMAVKDSLLN